MMKMRKILFILSCILLVACQGNKTDDQQGKNDKTNQKENLVLKQWRYLSQNGDGNEEGYYHFETDEGGQTHLFYTDYSMGKEVYLCNKPECKHNDESCTAYLSSENIEEMFVYKEHLYFIESSGDTVQIFGDGIVSSSKTAPHIYQMDLDGQNKRELCQLEEGYQFQAGNIVLDGENMYLSISKNDSIEMSKGSYLQVTTQNELYKIDLKTGKKEKIMNLYDGLSDKNIAAVEGRHLILNGYSYKENPQKYLDKKDFEGYDKVMVNGQSIVEILNIDTLKKETIQIKEDIQFNYYQNKIYYSDKNKIYTFDLKTQKKDEFISLDKGYEYNLGIYGDRMIIAQWKGEKFKKTLTTSLKKSDIKELKQYMRTPKEAVHILSMNSKNLFVVYDREGHYEKTWAGTMQYETKKEYKGIISIDDFFDNKKNYKKVSIIQ